MRRAAVILAMLVAAVALLWWGQRLRSRGGVRFAAAELAPGERLYPADDRYLIDPVIGHRPRPQSRTSFEIAAADGSVRHHCERATNDLGLVHSAPLPSPLTGPRVLLLGDSHMEGIVSEDRHAATAVQHRLRAEPTLAAALVLNASAAYYSLYQYVLRIRVLRDRLQPAVLVVVVFTGNDLLELEDVSRPHLDDELVERAPVTEPPPETTSARLAWLGMRRDQFFQGLNQACYAMQRPERVPVLLRKANRCLELLRAAAETDGAALRLVALPPYDLVRPDAVRRLGEAPRQVVDSGVAEQLHRGFVAAAKRQGLRCIDLLPAFRAHRGGALYGEDFHVFLAAHDMLADVLVPELIAALRDG
ncbi:MAG: hypothetical protein AAF628_02725 [Planctomycetota bacterium]